MQISIKNGQVDLSGEPILTDINIEINTASRIGVVGRNGCGKTTLLRLLSGELRLAPKAGDDDSSFSISGKPRIGILSQMTFEDDSHSMVDELRLAYADILTMQARLDELQARLEQNPSEGDIAEYSNLLDCFTNAGGFYFEKEYEAAIKQFGFTAEEKERPLSEFSGGQRTKIAFLKLLLSKPDLLLLDEPTNHLDIQAVRWLEEYLRGYKKAFIIVSHDRMFLDRTVTTVYEIERGRTTRYAGNYTEFTKQKHALLENRAKRYAEQQREIQHLQQVADRFRYKANKAAMAQSKLKQLERIERIEAPKAADLRAFHADFEPSVRPAKDVLSVKALEIGFDTTLSTVSFEVKRGDRIGILGGNGLGKSTLLKTLMGVQPARGGSFNFGAMVKVGYFDQQIAAVKGNQTVLDNYRLAYPHQNDFEARSALGAFLFSGEDVFKTLDMLSGGERVRLALCKLFGKRPNVLLLDEPTNHMDIVGKETLEGMLSDWDGTLIFVSHDRYFVQKLARKLLVFENGRTEWYEYGYEQYEQSMADAPTQEEEQHKNTAPSAGAAALADSGVEPPQKSGNILKQKKGFITPAKERSRLERALAKAEERIALLEEKTAGITEELGYDANMSDYLKLSALQQELAEAEEELEGAMGEWEAISSRLEEIKNNT